MAVGQSASPNHVNLGSVTILDLISPKRHVTVPSYRNAVSDDGQFTIDKRGVRRKRSLKMLVNVGKGIEKSIDPNLLPEAALAHVVMIGLRNVLMDCHASVTADEYPDADERKAVATAMVDKKLTALMAGDVRVQSTREGDPVRAEAIRMATAQITALIKKAGKKVSDYKSADIRAKAVERLTPELLAQAKARVEQLRATVPATETLADIGL